MKIFKSLLSLCAVLGLLVTLTGCPNSAHMEEQASAKIDPKGMVYYTFFNTVSYIYSYTDDSNEEFEQNCEEVSAILEEYHALFDIYYEHSGINNLRTINQNAGQAPVPVDAKLIDFLLYAKELYVTTNGEMNVMMGSVLQLWHDCREAASDSPKNATIPSREALEEANRHTDISLLEIDRENSTVRITDPDARIDVGALGKGYATEKAAQYLKAKGVDSYVLNIGGNIRIVGHKPDGSGWPTGIKDPQNTSQYTYKITIADTSCVTSGDYERYFVVDGEKYHHVIDKDTLMPARYFSSVTIITEDSAMADALSTALFCMSYEDGAALVARIGDVEVLWITPDGTQYKTPGFANLTLQES